MAVSASPVIQVFFRTDYKDMESAADGKYDHKAVPVVDGGVAYIWKLRSAPDKTWYQVKHQGGDIFEVSLQIGFSNQQAVFVVNVGNGAVEKKFDSISARYERAFGM